MSCPTGRRTNNWFPIGLVSYIPSFPNNIYPSWQQFVWDHVSLGLLHVPLHTSQEAAHTMAECELNVSLHWSAGLAEQTPDDFTFQPSPL